MLQTSGRGEHPLCVCVCVCLLNLDALARIDSDISANRLPRGRLEAAMNDWWLRGTDFAS